MTKDTQTCIAIYQDQLMQGDIKEAYMALIKYLSELKSCFPKQYKTGNISLGYLDYSYFSFTDPYLKTKKLRFGIVLNHQAMRIECWLMGQNADIQKTYWDILKNSEWNRHSQMPKYAIIEVILEEHLDFHSRDQMTDHVLSQAVTFAKEIETYLKNLEK